MAISARRFVLMTALLVLATQTSSTAGAVEIKALITIGAMTLFAHAFASSTVQIPRDAWTTDNHPVQQCSWPGLPPAPTQSCVRPADTWIDRRGAGFGMCGFSRSHALPPEQPLIDPLIETQVLRLFGIGVCGQPLDGQDGIESPRLARAGTRFRLPAQEPPPAKLPRPGPPHATPSASGGWSDSVTCGGDAIEYAAAA
jgi:hypothetical protein